MQKMRRKEIAKWRQTGYTKDVSSPDGRICIPDRRYEYLGIVPGYTGIYDNTGIYDTMRRIGIRIRRKIRKIRKRRMTRMIRTTRKTRKEIA